MGTSVNSQQESYKGKKGRPPKDCVVSEYDKVTQLKYLIA